MIEPKHPSLPVTRQCELLGLARASYYHRPEPPDDENLRSGAEGVSLLHVA